MTNRVSDSEDVKFFNENINVFRKNVTKIVSVTLTRTYIHFINVNV